MGNAKAKLGILATLIEEEYDSIPQEEIMALRTNLEEIPASDWEYDFIMAESEKNWYSAKERAIITRLYEKYIEGLDR